MALERRFVTVREAERSPKDGALRLHGNGESENGTVTAAKVPTDVKTTESSVIKGP
jgi:hypothetical protein